jgi:hypothetical protein
MARVINFFPRGVYMGTASGALTIPSEPFEIAEENELVVELRVYGSNPAGLVVTGYIETTSDASLLDSSWKQFTSPVSGTTLTTGVYTGLQRFVRAKLNVPVTGLTCTSVNAVARQSI